MQSDLCSDEDLSFMKYSELQKFPAKQRWTLTACLMFLIPLMNHSAIIPILKQTSLWPAQFCGEYAEYGAKPYKYIWNHEMIETQESWNHILIHEVYFKSESETHCCVAAILYLLNMCVRDKE